MHRAMATATVSLSRDSLACPICLELLNEPVTLPCGHSFCRGCIGRHWEMQQSGGCSCPSCRRSFEPRPWLGTSTLLAQIVCGLAQGAPPPTAAGPGDVTCDSCPRQQPLKAERSCLQCLASYCQAHLQPHRQSPAFRHHRLAPPLRDLGLRRCPLHGKPLESYCRTERRCVCWVCALREHRDHQVSTVEEEAARRQVRPGVGGGGRWRIWTWGCGHIWRVGGSENGGEGGSCWRYGWGGVESRRGWGV